MSSQAPKVLLVGAGALGSIFSWRLQESGQVEVTAVCRSNYQSVRDHGFRIKSTAFGEHTYKPSRVVQSVDEAVADGVVFDFILFCTKATPNLGDNTGIIAPAVQDPRTVIVVIQNGIGIEDPFYAKYPNNPIVSVIAYIDVSQPDDGVIDHGHVSLMLMGLHKLKEASYDVAQASERVEALNQVWNDSGVIATLVEDIAPLRWVKLVWNASFNTIAVVSGGNDTQQMLAEPECKQLIRNVMLEVYKVGEAATGQPLPSAMGNDGPDAFINETGNRPSAVIPSMLMDYRAKRPMEHEVILKRPIEIAGQLGIDVPFMESIHALLVMVEKSYLSSDNSPAKL